MNHPKCTVYTSVAILVLPPLLEAYIKSHAANIKSLLHEKQRVNWALLENKGRYSACTRWAGERERAREAISVNGDGSQCLASIYLFLLFLLLLFLWYCSIRRQRTCSNVQSLTDMVEFWKGDLLLHCSVIGSLLIKAVFQGDINYATHFA